MLNIEVINNIKRLESLRMAWNEALSRSEFDDVQLTWEWLYAWSSNFAKDSLFILAVWDKDRILAIAPLMKKTYRYLGLPVRSIKGLRNEYTMHFDFILTERAEECLELIFRRLGEETWDF
ncbi:MAG: hypothetical protein WC569_03640, partial [Candidatus Omnitrophota bacterium]